MPLEALKQILGFYVREHFEITLTETTPGHYAQGHETHLGTVDTEEMGMQVARAYAATYEPVGNLREGKTFVAFDYFNLFTGREQSCAIIVSHSWHFVGKVEA